MSSLEELRAVRSMRRLTKEEKLAYIKYWQSSNQSQRSFCEQESIPLPTFNSWLKSSSSKAVKEGNQGGFIAVGMSSQSTKQSHSLALQFKLPNGLVIEGFFSLSEIGFFIKELSHGLAPLC